MKKEYIVPDTEIIDFQLMDIVVTSGLGDLDPWDVDENGEDMGVSDDY